MALVFPSSPTNGQVFTDTGTGNRYVYDASKGVWKYSSNNVGVTVGTAPPPINQVAPGAMWYNTNTGRTFILYDDGDSKQWVENIPAPGNFDSSTVAGYANAASILAVAPAYNTTNAAFAKANTSLQNTSGTFAGNLSVSGNLVASTVTIAPANNAYSIEYVVVAGGGGGGYRYGGGGAGGYVSSVQGEISGGGHPARPVMWVTSGSSFTVTVGAGGAGSSSTSNSTLAHGSNGSNSIFGSVVAIGGGGGAGGSTSSPGDPMLQGWPGGSGGGATGDGLGTGSVYAGDGAYTQGFPGGNGWDQSGNNSGGGGGGAGARGTHARFPGDPGCGGDGVKTNISGTPTWYAGGGAGMAQNGNYGRAGLGGGGPVRNNGTTNTGGGGGAGYDSTAGSGGSGIVIVRYANSTQRGSGGTVTSTTINGVTYWIHTFTSSGTFVA